jgi:hypothetical protein
LFVTGEDLADNPDGSFPPSLRDLASPFQLAPGVDNRGYMGLGVAPYSYDPMAGNAANRGLGVSPFGYDLMGGNAYRSPSVDGLGSWWNDITAAINGGTGSGVATGAAVGSVVPVVGTGIGAAIGGLLSIFGGKDKTGLPQQPINDYAFAHALAMKWFNLYAQDYTSTDNYGYWTTQIMQDGPQRAWANFSSSPEMVQKNVTAAAAAYASQYGGPFVLQAGAEMGAPPGSPFLAPKQASILGALTPTSLLLGGGLLFAAVVLTKMGGRRSHAPNPRRRRRR